MNVGMTSEQDGQKASLIRAALGVLSEHMGTFMCESTEPTFKSDAPTRHGRLAELLYRERVERNELIGFSFDGEPAWDILLDLFSQQNTGKRVSITSACIASRAPSTTALRWISLMVERSVLIRIEDTDDRRRTYLELSQVAFNRLKIYLEEIDRNRLFT